MLVLERKKGQSVNIGGIGRVTVCDIGKGKVRIGFEFDKSLSLLRTELVPEDLRSFAPSPPLEAATA